MRVLCILLLLLLTPGLVWAADDATAVRAQVTLETIGVVEQNYYWEHRQYVKLETLIAIGWLKPDEAADCELALSWDRQRFVAVVQIPGATWYIDKRQELNSFQGDSPITAKDLLETYYDLDAQDEIAFFQRKTEEPKIVAALIKRGVHQVQLSVERWAVDHNGRYPLSLDDVVTKGYVEQGFYANPCTATGIRDRNAKDTGTWSAGDFNYRPKIVDGEALEYYILGYGPDPHDGWDWDGDNVKDGVIIILSSGTSVP